MIKFLKTVFLILVLLGLGAWLSIRYFYVIAYIPLASEELFYVLEFFLLIAILLRFAIPRKPFAYFFLGVLAIGAFFNVLNLHLQAETLIRIAFVGLIVAISQFLIDAVREKETNRSGKGIKKNVQ